MIADKFQQLWDGAAAGNLSSVLAVVCFVGIYLCITVALEIGLWKRSGALSKKLLWSLVLTIPVMGWLFYLAFYKLPPSKPPC